MPLRHMRNLVRQHRGEKGIVVHEIYQAGIDKDLL